MSSRVLVSPDRENLVSYLEWCCFYTHFYSLVNIFPPLAGSDLVSF